MSRGRVRLTRNDDFFELIGGWGVVSVSRGRLGGGWSETGEMIEWTVVVRGKLSGAEAGDEV